MRLNVKAMAITLALIWGVLAMFLVALANLIWPPYGEPFLKMMASVYPGYEGTASLGQAVIGGCYGLLDGAIAGALIAWLYNLFAAGDVKKA